MKTTTMTLLALLCITCFTSCDEIDELTEFDADFTLTESIDVAVEEGDEAIQTFSRTATFDLTDDDDVAENLDAIESVTINALTYRFSNVLGAGARITAAQMNVGSTSIAINAVTPSDAAGQVFTVSDTAALNTIAAALRSNPQATMTYSGSVENAPLSFTVSISMNVTAVIDPI